MLKRLTLFVFGLCLLILLTAGCDKGSSSDDGEDTPPLPDLKTSGVWAGYIGSEDDFYLGIITEENEVRLISNYSQLAGPENSFRITPNTSAFEGTLLEMIFNYSTTDFVTDEDDRASWEFLGFVATTTLLWGGCQDSDEVRSFSLIYSTTYTNNKVTPSIENISGTWHLANTMGIPGNTISLVITPDPGSTTSGSIQVYGNSGDALFDEGRISIHYSNSVPCNIYDVSIITLDDIELTGLAAYVNYKPSPTMAIGVSANSSGTYRSFSGLANKSD